MKKMFKSFWADESGQGLTEYALIIALVAIGLIIILIAFRDAIVRIFVAIRGELNAPPTNQFTG